MNVKLSRFLTFAQYGFILILPFAVLYWVNPLTSELTIGNDYPVFHIDQQMELQYSLKHGTFPLFAPGFAMGHSSAALTLGQLYHPLPHLSALFPGYWKGDALRANTFWRLVSLGLVHLALFILLNRLRLRPAISFILSFITVYNLRMLDLFRYGASLENYVALILLCTFMAFYYIKPTRVVGKAAIIGSTYLLICGGHPQMMYLGLLGAGIVALLLPYSLAAISPEVVAQRPRVLKFYGTMALCLFAGGLLASAYTFPFYFEFIGENASRVGRDYRWSLAYGDSWSGVLNSFFRPLYSVVMSSFGSSSIIILTLLLPLCFALRRAVPKVIIFLLAASTFIFLCGLGDQTPVHYLFWRFFPLADVFRTPGRIYMTLPFLFLLILAWQLKRSDEWLEARRWSMRLSPVLVLVLISIAVYLVYNLFIVKVLPPPTHYIPFRIEAYPGSVDTFIYVSGLCTLVLLAVYIFVRKLKPVVGVLLVASVLLQGAMTLRYGTWVTKSNDKPKLSAIDKQKISSLSFRGLPGFGMESPAVAEQTKRSILDNKMARFYRSYVAASSQKAAYDYLTTRRKPSEAVVEVSRASKPKPACSASQRLCGMDDIALKESSFNRLVFTVSATESGVLTLSNYFNGRWKVWVNGKEEEAFRANGYLTGVFVPKGRHEVEWRYSSPATFAGITVSLLTLLFVAVFFSFQARRLPLRAALIAAAVIATGGIFYAWFASLYSGDNLRTVYHWQSNTFAPDDNIAYGRTTAMSSNKSFERPYDFYAGKAVDGDRNDRGFVTAPKANSAWWQVDLGASCSLSKLVIYDNAAKTRSEFLPLTILISDDGESFTKAMVLTDRPKTREWTVPLNGAIAQFVKMKTSCSDSFTFKEVEVYGTRL